MLNLHQMEYFNTKTKQYFFTILISLLAFGANGQNIIKNQFIKTYCPQYTSSGANTLLATYFKASIVGLSPGETYRYYVTVVPSDSIGKAYAGVGGSLFLDLDSPSVYVNTPNFSAGNYDSFTISNPLETRWFAFVPSTATEFTAGNYVVPIITLEGTGTSAGFTARFALNDSIKVLSYSSSAGANNGTGLYGLSKGVAKNMVLVYDTNKFTSKPLTIGMIENDKLLSSSYNAPSYYNTNVDGVAGAWAGILPNNLANGVRRIDRRDFETNAILHTNLDTNGLWLNVETKNPSGGATQAIALTADEAALVPTEVEFVNPFSSINEGGDSFAVLVKRRYSSEDTAKVDLTLLGGSATNNVDFIFPSNYQFLFAPGKETTNTFKFKIIDDNLTEGNEAFTLKIVNPINTTRGQDSSQSITIVDNDTSVINFVNTSIITREGLGDAIAKISIDKGTTGLTTVKAVIKSKSVLTTIPGEFFLSVNTTLDTLVEFNNGLAEDTFNLNCFIVDESSIDAPDTVVIVLRHPSGFATIGPDSILTIIIKDNDAPPGVRFTSASQTISEKIGSIDVLVELLNRNNNPSDFSLKYIANRSSVTEGTDFIFNPSSKIYSFGLSGSDTMTISIPIIDDIDFEANEVLVMAVEGTVNCKTYLPDTLRITIVSDDKEKVSIAVASAINSTTGIANRLGNSLSVSGITHGFNRKSVGNQFTMIDATGGIQIASISNVSGYNYKQGDSLTIIGRVEQINGVTQIGSLDTIITHKSGLSLVTPAITNSLNEGTEQEYVSLNNIRFYNVTNWPSSPLSANAEAFVYAVNKTKDTLEIRIDAEGNMDGTPAPSVNRYYDLVGIGSQNDPSNPFLSNYYLDALSITLVNSPQANFANTSITVSEISPTTNDIVVNFTNTGSQNIGFDVEDTKTGTATPVTNYGFNTLDVNVLPTETSFMFKVNIEDNTDTSGNKTIKIALRRPKYGTIIGVDSIVTITIEDDEVTNVIRLKNTDIKIYPNPASNYLQIDSKKSVDEIKMYNNIGSLVLNQSKTDPSLVDISLLPNGLYHLILTIEGQQYSAQVLKN